MNETENQNKLKHKNVLWWMFLIQFVCLVCLFLIFAIVSSINGVAYNFFGDQTPHYGFEAFEFVFIFSILGFWYIFLPSAIAFVVGLILLVTGNGKKNNRKEETIESKRDNSPSE